MSYSVQGGVYLEANREKTLHKPVFAFDRVASVKIPLGGSGIDFTPAVAPGDTVRLGQAVGVSARLPGFALRASVSGTVTEIADGVLPDGRSVPCVGIENDLRDEPELLGRPMDWQQMEPKQINEIICAAGVVGRGGYPSFVKIGRMLGRADTLIVDGLDGEPWLSAVYRALCEDADDIVEGAHVLMHLFGRLRCVVAMPEERGEAAQAMRHAIGGDNRIRLIRLRDKYPQNDEKLLIRTITGRDAAGERDTRCLVLEAQELAAIGRALRDGRPDISRIVTVSGDAVANPKNIRARIGTAWYELVRVCGGYSQTPVRLLAGGVMRGAATFTDNIALAPGAQAFTALCTDTSGTPSPCIRCGRCAQVCPYGLMPNYVHFFLENGNFEKLSALGVEHCTACGACACVCPAHIRLTQSMLCAQKTLSEPEERQA